MMEGWDSFSQSLESGECDEAESSSNTIRRLGIQRCHATKEIHSRVALQSEL